MEEHYSRDADVPGVCSRWDLVPVVAQLQHRTTVVRL